VSKDEREGKEKRSKGKVREEVGKITGNKKEQLKGKVEQAEGKVKEKFRKAKRKLRAPEMAKKMEVNDRMTDEEIVMSGLGKIREAAGDFRDSVGSNFRDMQTEVKDWRFAVEHHQEGTVIDVSVKILIKRKPKE
jgi:uncharacterized protein YjbJ (UPF0337 family)